MLAALVKLISDGETSNFMKTGSGSALRLLIAVSACAAILPGISADTPGVKDLTGLSLQQLYEMEIVQLNVLGAHTHPKGQFMFGYQYMYMQMEDYRVGAHSLTPEEVLSQYGYPTVHEQMRMQMHMVEAMYAFTDDLTVMAMLPYKNMSMDHLMANGDRFTQHADGIGDVEAMALYTILGSTAKGYRLVLNGGMSFPTGSINSQDYRMGDTANPKIQLEYPMQLGSGTYDMLTGLTYLGNYENWVWGAQGMATVRLGRNDRDYSFGNVYRGTAWIAYGITDWFAPSLRTEFRHTENIDGRDTRLNPLANPEADPNHQGGDRLDLLFGVNFYVPKGPLKGMRVIVEGGLPVYERLDGPQLSTSFFITAGLNYSF